jgi:molybdenum cofactor cytidylyltransferase
MDDIAHEDEAEQGLDDDVQDLALLDERLADEPDPSTERTLVVVLAAGAGSRYSGDTHKLEAVVGDRTVAEHSIVAAIASGVGDVIVITGASQPSPDTMSALSGATTTDARASDPGAVDDGTAETAETIQFIHNPDWADGQAVSLQVALEEASRVEAEAIVVGLADQPGVTPEAWRRVAASRSPIAVATYDGVRGNPVRLHRSVWQMLAPTGDEGARSLMRLRPELVEQIPCPGSAHDIDTREDLQLWQSRSSTSSP